jgi:hypothetical protein
MLKGGSVENVWQPMSAETWNSPSSRCTSFIAENTGRSGQPMQKPGGRGGTGIPSSSAARRLGAVSDSNTSCTLLASSPSGAASSTNLAMPVSTTSPVYSPAIGRTSLPWTRVALTSARRRIASMASWM